MDESQPNKPAKPSMISQIIVLGLVTLFAFGGGWGYGKFILEEGATLAADSSSSADVEDTALSGELLEVPDDQVADMAAEEDLTDETGVEQISPGNAMPLEPIIANLAAPADTWVRLEMSVLFAAAPNLEIAQAIHQDTLAYIKTVKLHQIDGPSGYLHLRSDLRELAKTRSGGEAQDILIRALLFE